jgi:hypothetical protein
MSTPSTELADLIKRLKKGIIENAAYIKTIRHPELLVIALEELNTLIGNEMVKDSVATQIQHLIMVKHRSTSGLNVKEDEVMLNTALYGPPGVGKTLIGTKLAKIWYCLGFIKGSSSKPDKEPAKGILEEYAGIDQEIDSLTAFYLFYMALMILVVLWWIGSFFYTAFGVIFTVIIAASIMFLVLYLIYTTYYPQGYTSSKSSTKESTKKDNTGNIVIDTRGKTDEEIIEAIAEKMGKGTTDTKLPADSELITIVSRDDFVGQYVGWTAPKTLKLLKANIGKVLFVDEAYSLLNGPHDEFGMEALNTLTKFLSEHANEIIVIFAGYRDQLTSGIYSTQPGLRRRFMWHFDCQGYNASELFDIFRLQLQNKGWTLSNEEEIRPIFVENADAFPSYGGDTERAAFFAELEHSRDYINNSKNMKMNMLEAPHVRKGVQKLRQNIIKDDSSNSLMDIMKLMNRSNEMSNLYRQSQYAAV